MVRIVGLEPTTCNLEGCYSIHLSYIRILVLAAGLEPAHIAVQDS